MSSKPHQATAASGQSNGRKQKQPPAASADSDDEQFQDLPREAPTKKQKKSAASAAHVPNLDPEATAAAQAAAAKAAAKAASKKGISAVAPVAASIASTCRKSGGKRATVPLVGGDDDIDMIADDAGDDSDDEGKGVAKAVAMTKTEAKAARFYDRPAVAAASLLPNPQARTPSHVKSTPTPAPASSSSSAASASGMLQPLASATAAASTGVTKSLPSTRKVIVVLVKASLETVKTTKGYELVSADSHKHVLQKLKKDPSEYRPDILHQCLLTLLDSPLNKAGHLQVYIQTEKQVLIEVHPTIRIPRTFKRFAGLMVQLLHKLKIRSSDSSDMLLKVIRNPVTDHLPVGALKIGMSVQADLVDIRELAANVIGEQPAAPVVFCVGSHANGPADVNWTDKSVALSKYPLSASVCLGRICNAFEGIWGVL
jgi:rRNA small subunit pseudouridine methyltransferase Nep1